MPKAYWIAHVQINDPEGYKDYVATAKPAFERFGARFLARGGAYEALEGDSAARNVVIEFESMQAARACYDAPEYQAAKAIREKHAVAKMMMIVEGHES